MSTIELNLRLDVRDRASTTVELAQRQDQALALLGTCEHRRHDAQVNGALVPCLVARVEGWSQADVHELAVKMDQDCIAVLDVTTGKGSLIGPRTEGYGDFDLAHFHRLKVLFKKLPRTRIAGPDDPIYRSGLAITAVRRPSLAPGQEQSS